MKIYSILLNDSKRKERAFLPSQHIYTTSGKDSHSPSIGQPYAYFLDHFKWQGDGVPPLARPESYAHLCEGKGCLEVLPNFHGMKKGLLSPRKRWGQGMHYTRKIEEERLDCTTYQGSLHACCFIFSHSDQWETKN